MIATEIAKWIKGIKYDDLPKSTVEIAKNYIIDTLGVCIRGSSYDSSKVLFSILEKTIDNPCTFIGLGMKGSAMQTALFNGVAGHSVEMDDDHIEAILHPGVVVIPASFSIAEELEASGEEWILSIVVGYEIMIRVGLASRGSQQERGFHPTGTCGSFGSAASVSKLLGLNTEQIAKALGIAGSFTGGLLEFHSTGAWTKRLNAGLAARTGLLAARLAKFDYTGPETIFEGKSGFLTAYCNRYDLEPLHFSGLKNYKIEEVSIKPYSSCRFTHSPIDGLIELLNKYKIKAEEINQIIVEMCNRSYKATMEPLERKYNPSTQVDGQFSTPFCLALAAHYGFVHPECFAPEYLFDEKLRNTASKVKAFVTEEFERLYPAKYACRVTVKTDSGEYSTVIIDAKGDPGNPFSREEINEKFTALSKEIIGEKECNILLEKLQNLENVEKVNELFSF